jgi:uncharacterized RDD family membrane protein YckC
MSRMIRNERARELQGRRAGIASRAIAFAIDLAIAFGIYIALVVGMNVLWDVLFSEKIEVPAPPGWFSGPGIFLVLVVSLTLGWGSTGRSIGNQVIGLRVVRADARPLRSRHAFARAVLCAVFYPGLLLTLFDRRNRSLQDVICRTVVVYDWVPEAARPRKFPVSATQ